MSCWNHSQRMQEQIHQNKPFSSFIKGIFNKRLVVMVVWLVLYIFLPPFGDFFLYNQKKFLKNNLGADLTWTVPVPCPILFGQRDIKEIYCQNQSDCIVAIVKWTLCILTPDQIKYYKIKSKTIQNQIARHRTESPHLCNYGTEDQWQLNRRAGLKCSGHTDGEEAWRLQQLAHKDRQSRGGACPVSSEQ